MLERAKRIETFYNAFREMSTLMHSSNKVEELLELAVWKATELLDAKGARDISKRCGRYLARVFCKIPSIFR